MKESFQERSNSQEQDEQARFKRENIEYYKKHSLKRYLSMIRVRLESMVILLPPPIGTTNRELRKLILEREAHTGLLKGSILANELYFPDEESASLTRRVAIAGRWVAYDFNRPIEFGRRGRNRQLKQGKLVAFPLDEIIENEKEEYTPTDKLDIFNPVHILQFETPSIEELLSHGFAEEVTYEQAYKAVGLWEQTGNFILQSEIANKTILMITPKGNGLVFLSTGSGDSEPEPKGLRQFKPAIGFQYA